MKWMKWECSDHRCKLAEAPALPHAARPWVAEALCLAVTCSHAPHCLSPTLTSSSSNPAALIFSGARVTRPEALLFFFSFSFSFPLPSIPRCPLLILALPLFCGSVCWRERYVWCGEVRIAPQCWPACVLPNSPEIAALACNAKARKQTAARSGHGPGQPAATPPCRLRVSCFKLAWNPQRQKVHLPLNFSSELQRGEGGGW